uniref:Trehalose 6-phosphate phosphatase n=1 Tax=Galeruca daurica TaxID=1651263 RepID=A0A386IPA2_9CUCU|nr:trealose-6-phosphate phosphatase [Galeruca daurica]
MHILKLFGFYNRTEFALHLSTDMCSTTGDLEEYVTKYLEGSSNLSLLLDYDGTLTPIVAHPDLATIPPETKDVLERLSQIPEIFVAIISGRAVDNVKSMVGVDTITYAGNHGLEVLYPDGSRYNHQLPSNFDDQLKELIAKLEKKVVRDGAWIENKGSTLTFHYRATPEPLKETIRQEAEKIIQEANFKIGKAHMAIEVRPKVEWNKGSIALLLLEKKYGNNWNKETKVIFIGDDTTDEDAMKALKGNAATFRIAKCDAMKTNAEKIISSTDNVIEILKLVDKYFKK